MEKSCQSRPTVSDETSIDELTNSVASLRVSQSFFNNITNEEASCLLELTHCKECANIETCLNEIDIESTNYNTDYESSDSEKNYSDNDSEYNGYTCQKDITESFSGIMKREYNPETDSSSDETGNSSDDSENDAQEEIGVLRGPDRRSTIVPNQPYTRPNKNEELNLNERKAHTRTNVNCNEQPHTHETILYCNNLFQDTNNAGDINVFTSFPHLPFEDLDFETTRSPLIDQEVNVEPRSNEHEFATKKPVGFNPPFENYEASTLQSWVDIYLSEAETSIENQPSSNMSLDLTDMNQVTTCNFEIWNIDTSTSSNCNVNSDFMANNACSGLTSKIQRGNSDQVMDSNYCDDVVSPSIYVWDNIGNTQNNLSKPTHKEVYSIPKLESVYTDQTSMEKRSTLDFINASSTDSSTENYSGAVLHTTGTPSVYCSEAERSIRTPPAFNMPLFFSEMTQFSTSSFETSSADILSSLHSTRKLDITENTDSNADNACSGPASDRPAFSAFNTQQTNENKSTWDLSQENLDQVVNSSQDSIYQDDIQSPSFYASDNEANIRDNSQKSLNKEDYFISPLLSFYTDLNNKQKNSANGTEQHTTPAFMNQSTTLLHIQPPKYQMLPPKTETIMPAQIRTFKDVGQCSVSDFRSASSVNGSTKNTRVTLSQLHLPKYKRILPKTSSNSPKGLSSPNLISEAPIKRNNGSTKIRKFVKYIKLCDRKQYEERLNRIINEGNKLDFKNEGKTIFHAVIKKGFPHFVIVMLECIREGLHQNPKPPYLGGICDIASFVDIQDSLGRTALYLSVENNFLSLTKFLLEEANADPNISHNVTGETCLHVACKKGEIYLETVKALCKEKRMNFDTRNNLGKTALHEAINSHNEIFNSLPIVTTMLRCGARLNVEDADGLTPIHVVVQKKNKPLLEIMQKYGSDFREAVNAKDGGGRTALEFAILLNVNNDIMKILITYCPTTPVSR